MSVDAERIQNSCLAVKKYLISREKVAHSSNVLWDAMQEPCMNTIYRILNERYVFIGVLLLKNCSREYRTQHNVLQQIRRARKSREVEIVMVLNSNV